MKLKLLFLGLALSAMSVFAQDETVNPRQKGYRGNVALGTFYDVQGEGGNGPIITTTHGYQLNPHIFLGGGLGATYFETDKSKYAYTIVPYFADFRWHWLNKKVTPFFDLKAGGSVVDCSDGTFNAYFASPGLGVSFGWNNKMAMNILLSYDYHEFEADLYYYGEYAGTTSLHIDGPALKVSLEW